MNWKLILQLSLFGLAMGLATVFVIPANIEPVFWLVIFLVCAYVIAHRCPAQRFQHGLYLGMINSLWITACHVLLYDQYMVRHPDEALLMKSLPIADFGRLLMTLIGLATGAVSGIVIGVLALIAGKVLRPAAGKS